MEIFFPTDEFFSRLENPARWSDKKTLFVHSFFVIDSFLALLFELLTHLAAINFFRPCVIINFLRSSELQVSEELINILVDVMLLITSRFSFYYSI